MKIKNADMPAMPLPMGSETSTGCKGLTKREMFCLHMGVPETGDAELDEIICKGNRKNTLMQIMCVLLSSTEINCYLSRDVLVAGMWAASEANDIIREMESAA